MSDGSVSAIIEQAKSGKRYECRDKALAAFAKFPRCTSSEIARHVLDQDGVSISSIRSMMDVVRIGTRVASIQKRVSDLTKLGYITDVDKRACEVTRFDAAVYVVADKGAEYLRNHGIRCAVPDKVAAAAAAAEPVVVVERDKRSGLDALRAAKAALN